MMIMVITRVIWHEAVPGLWPHNGTPHSILYCNNKHSNLNMEPARAHHINDDIIIGLNHHKYQHICPVCEEEKLHFHCGQQAFNILIPLECRIAHWSESSWTDEHIAPLILFLFPAEYAEYACCYAPLLVTSCSALVCCQQTVSSPQYLHLTPPSCWFN